jgi:hypothetical protein
LCPTIREQVLAAVKHIIKGEAIAAGVVKESDVQLIVSYPSIVNNPEAALKLEETFTPYLDKNHTWKAPQHTAIEDVSLLASAIKVPSVFWD